MTRRATLRVLLALSALLAAAPGAAARPLPGVASGVYAGAGDPAPLAAVGARWTYGWSPRSPLPRRPVAFVPMAWGAGSVTPGNLVGWAADRRAGRTRWLLGFNEPDQMGQANLTPDRAVALWPQLQRTGLRLVSPAVASPFARSPTHPGRSWLDDFMVQAGERGLRVDAIALHFYGDWTNPGTVRWIDRAVRMVHARWGRPVWITEVGTLPAWRWEHHPAARRPTAARARAHLRRLLGAFDRLPYVTRVAWFMDRCGGSCAASALLGPGGRPTTLGRAFARAASAWRRASGRPGGPGAGSPRGG